MLYHGDNLDVMRRDIADGVVDLCYIDPPFHSRRDYKAFTDVWKWDEEKARELDATDGRTGILLRAFRETTGEGGLLAYLAAMAPRVEEIHRTLKLTGTFFLHCDPTASHYLKLICDAVFVPAGGALQNEIVWCYSHGGRSKRHFGRKHDVILFYSKSAEYTFNEDALRIPMRSGKESFGGRLLEDESGRKYRLVYGTKNGKGETRYYKYFLDEGKVPEDWWTDINSIQSGSAERLGYPTQKPEALLKRILLACTNPGDVVLDAFCGSGTTLAVAKRLKRRWIGIDSSEEAVATANVRLGTGGGHQPRR
jgi:site-specific DNA-methyltransferase (adenine-specific)